MHRQLEFPEHMEVTVSYSGGLFQERDLVLSSFRSNLAATNRRYRVAAPRLPAVAGAALYAAKLAGTPLTPEAVRALETDLRTQPTEPG